MSAARADRSGHPARSSDLAQIAGHAATVLAGQLAVMAFGVTDTVVAGRYSTQALAALSVGSAIFISVYVSLNGVFQALLPVWSELAGAGRNSEVGRSLRQSLYLWLLASAVGVATLLSPGALLRWVEVPTALIPEVGKYLAVLAAGLPAALLFRIYGTLNQSLGHPRMVTWLQLAALALKVPLSAWFALGGAGMAAHGVVGCAWATLTINAALAIIAMVLMRRHPLYRPYELWRWPEAPDRKALGAFARLGIPAGLAIMVEVTSFTLMALFIARQGALATAAHQIAASMAATLYMVPLSVAIATSARVSRWLGTGDAVRARRAGVTGLRLSIAISTVLAFTTWWAAPAIARLYTLDATVGAAAAGLLGWVAAYHLADSVQCVCIFVLRCYRVTVAPLVIYGLMLWIAGLGGGYFAAYHSWGGWGPWPNPATFWVASAAALAVTAGAFAWLLASAASRPRMTSTSLAPSA